MAQPISKSNWPPAWLHAWYCHWAGRINRIAAIAVSGVMLALILGIAWALFTAPARAEDVINLKGKLPAWGFLRCWHPYDDLMEDEFYCQVGKDESRGYPLPIIAVTSLKAMMEQGWKVKELVSETKSQGHGAGKFKIETHLKSIYMEKAKP